MKQLEQIVQLELIVVYIEYRTTNYRNAPKEKKKKKKKKENATAKKFNKEYIVV